MQQILITFAQFRNRHALHHADANVFSALAALPQYRCLKDLAVLAGCRKPHLIRSLGKLCDKGLVLHVAHGRYAVEPGVLDGLQRQCGVAA